MQVLLVNVSVKFVYIDKEITRKMIAFLRLVLEYAGSLPALAAGRKRGRHCYKRIEANTHLDNFGLIVD